MSSQFAHATRYDIIYDFADDMLLDWEPEEVAAPMQQRIASPLPSEKVSAVIYDGMAGLFIAEDAEELAIEYAALANYILDNVEICIPFLTANHVIVHALQHFTAQVRVQWPAAYALVDQLDVQLMVILNA
jgi:hypothetical protein